MSSSAASRLSLVERPRRLRRTDSLRRMAQETVLTPSDLIQPFFIVEGHNERQPIASMPGQARLSVDLLVEEARRLRDLGVPGIALFPKVADSTKTIGGDEAWNDNGLVSRAIKTLKDAVPEIMVIGDVALDPFTTSGQDGLLADVRWPGGQRTAPEIVNDETVAALIKQSLCQARAGVDVIAPSDMMDGRIGAIRSALDEAGFERVCLLSYAAKYASGFYGPFRDALDSAPRGGLDKKTYQMDPANRREALREVRLDVEQGADMVMVKPAVAYLDVVLAVKQAVTVPVAAYHVSGEYAMLKAAAERGWIDGDRCMLETVLSIKRAGADVILTYATRELAEALNA
jgi:porphobilinogen synthase